MCNMTNLPAAFSSVRTLLAVDELEVHINHQAQMMESITTAAEWGN